LSRKRFTRARVDSSWCLSVVRTGVRVARDLHDRASALAPQTGLLSDHSSFLGSQSDRGPNSAYPISFSEQRGPPQSRGLWFQSRVRPAARRPGARGSLHLKGQAGPSARGPILRARSRAARRLEPLRLCRSPPPVGSSPVGIPRRPAPPAIGGRLPLAGP